MSKALVATSRERLYLNRFGTGFTQKSLAKLRAAGTPEAWLDKQLSPGSVPELAKVATIDNCWFADLRLSPAEKAATNKGTGKKAWQYGNDLGNWTIQRRIYSERSVLETMADFWTTVLHIPIGHDRAWVYQFDYDATIREHAFGRFEDMLTACSLHPAMRVYLDNYRSVRGKPNENQGRELLELHTVGRGAGYTEAMVKSSAVLLSGYTVDWGNTYDARYDAKLHTTGPVKVLDFTHENAAEDGQAATEAYLKYLANHPATARNLATKLATYFVSDTPVLRPDRLAGAGLHGLGHEHRGGAEGAGHPPGVPHLGGAEGPYTRPRPRGHCARARHRRARARSPAALGPTRPTTCTAPTGCSPGRVRTARRWSVVRGPRRLACSPAMACTRAWPVAGGPRRLRRTALGTRGYPCRPCASTRTSTTSAGPGWVAPPTPDCRRRQCRP